MIDGWSSPFRFLSNWQEASFCFPDLIAVWEPIILLCVFPRISLLTDGRFGQKEIAPISKFIVVELPRKCKSFLNTSLAC